MRLGGWIAAAIVLLVASATADAVEELRFFRIGTAATTGTYFQIGGVLANAISKPPGVRDCAHGGSCGVQGLVAVAQASQGSIQNAIGVGSGEIESALVQSDIAYWAYAGAAGGAPKRCAAGKGEAPQKTGLALLKGDKPIRNLRAIAGLYPEDIHVVVRSESAIRNLQDLKGKRVALGEPESGTLADARLVLEAAGLGECDLKAEYFRLSEAASALVDDRIDAFFMVGGYPVPAITDIATTIPTRLIPIPHDVAERVTGTYPFFTIDAIPAGAYPGLDSDTATLSTMALWVTRSQVDDDLVYAVTKSLWSDATKHLLGATHPAGRRIRLESALDGLVIPIHPGAARYYREAGVKIPDGL
jgi:TRAP transporter TAXI family solute receptor